MHRKKPQSGKAKKEQLQNKRAERRDDCATSNDFQNTIVPSTEVRPNQRTSLQLLARRHATGATTAEDMRRIEARKAARTALQSRFIKLSPEYIDHYRSVLAKRPFTRPISPAVASMNDFAIGNLATEAQDCLTCPKRPKWKYHMTKKEVEKNESMMFEKWLFNTESRLRQAESKTDFQVMGYFERNLDVWRQLWRVSEVSEILLVLLDVRCPLLHIPPSLEDYVSTLKPRKKCIMILTKVDLVPQALAAAWQVYLKSRYGYEVITVESYKEHERGENTQGTRTRFDVGASLDVRKALVAALQKAHRDLCTPPAQMKEENKPFWRPRIRTDIDWDSLIDVPEEEALRRAEVKSRREGKLRLPVKSGPSGQVEVPSAELSKAEAKKLRRLLRQEDLEAKEQKHKSLIAAQAPKKAHYGATDDETREEKQEAIVTDDKEGSDEEDASSQSHEHTAPPFLSIGLIGQPNVGKSSLLNALLGKKVVRASRTPGKTKSLQTIYWSKDVRLVDCPGLVFPSFVGMEKQVMAGVIPIQNVESVVYELGERMPLERILDLKMPEEVMDDRSGEVWSTDSLLATLALDRGFLTAKAARPDVYRAGSMLLRAFHSSQIAWAFRPSPEEVPGAPQQGLWLPAFQASKGKDIGHNSGLKSEDVRGEDTEEVTTMDEGSQDVSDVSESEMTETEEEEEDSEAEPEMAQANISRPKNGTASAFAMLAIDASDSSSEEDS